MNACRVGLVADDLTGASDTAVQFARRGWDALLVLEHEGMVRLKPDPTRYSVLALTTDCRAATNDIAEQRTAAAVAQLIAAGVDRLYLKIDSTMRGSIPGQIAGALNAWRVKYTDAVAVMCPAYPRMGRTVVDNHLLVNGEPVEQTAIGRDPITPVKASDLAALVPPSPHIFTADASRDQDLVDVASSIENLGAAAIPVGSAGLADAMAATWDRGGTVRRQTGQPLRPDTRRILIQVTSLNPVSRAQVQRLGRAFPEIVVLSGRAEEVSAELADRFASANWDLLGFVGGDGARAAMHRLGASAIRILDAQVEGIPIGRIVGGRADGRAVFTKAGGFGSEDALVGLVEGLRR